jgi:hypothetical protein
MTKSILLALIGLVAAMVADAQPQAQPSPEAELKRLTSEVEALKKQVVPAGAVMTFDLESCPKGWKEYQPAPASSAGGFPSPPPMPGLQGRMPPFMALRMCQKD